MAGAVALAVSGGFSLGWTHSVERVRWEERWRVEGDRLHVQLTVDDSGPGVPEAAAATIFDPFNTGKAGREGAGAGLGLAICRQIVEAHGGTLTAENFTRPNDTETVLGARFIVRLPRE